MNLKIPILIVATDREKRIKGGEGEGKSEGEGGGERRGSCEMMVEEREGRALAMSLGCEYVEVSTSQYQGFRTLANIGLTAVLKSKKMAKAKKTPNPPPPPPPLSPSPSTASASLLKKEKEQCVLM